MSKRAPRSVEFNFLLIAVDRNGFRRMKEEGQIDGARCPFSTFLGLQGDHQCACAQKWCLFSFFPRAFKQKKIKALRPKMTKIASRSQGVMP